MADPFSVLGAGIHFNRKKYGADIAKVESRAPSQTAHVSPRVAQDKPALGSLDFFGTAPATAPATAPRVSDLSDPPRTGAGTTGTPQVQKKRGRSGGKDEGESVVETRSTKKKKKKVVVVVAAKATRKASEDLGDTPISIFTPGESARKRARRRSLEGRDDDDNDGTYGMRGEELVQLEEMRHLRKKNRIYVEGDDVPRAVASFADLGLHPFLVEGLTAAGYTTPTAIQKQAISCMLEEREVLACAPTGTGKTASFVLPILHRLRGPRKELFRAMILVPTRELATQTYSEVVKLATPAVKFNVCVLTKIPTSGKGNKKQAPKFTDGSAFFDILITTPMRVVHLLKDEPKVLSNLRIVVLDEADRLFDDDYVEQIDEIMAACTHKKVQYSLFSATLPERVEGLGKSIMKAPVRVMIGARNSVTPLVKQELLFTGTEEGKLLALKQIIKKGIRPPVMIFVQSKERATHLYQELLYDGLNVDVIHAQRPKDKRDKIVENFRKGKVWVLVCTELMARGVDFEGVSLVINYDFPQSVVSYVHRIGRTGRRQEGEALTFFTEEDAGFLRTIVNVMKESGCVVPEWMLKLKPMARKQRKYLENHAPKRKSIRRATTKFDRIKQGEKKRMIQNTKGENKTLAKGGVEAKTS